MKKYILMSILLLFSSLVLATAPTTPSTLSPLDNAIYFNAPTITCSGSTDAEENPIHYNIFITPEETPPENLTTSPTYINGSSFFTFSFPNFYQGNSTENPNRMWGSSGSDNEAKSDYYFQNDSISVYQKGCCDSVPCSNNQYNEFYINGVRLFNENIKTEDCSSWTEHTIDTTSYQGGVYEIKWAINNGPSGDVTNYYFWLDNMYTQIYRNTSNIELDLTPHTYPYVGLDVGKTFNWACKSCDNNTECSSPTTARSFHQMNLSQCTSGNIAQQFNLLNETGSEDLGVYTQDCSYSLTSAFDTRAYNFALAGLTSYSFCLDPVNVSVTLNGFCQYDSTLSGYSYARQYYFDDVTLDGDTIRSYNLYQLEDALSTAITFSVTEAGVPLENRIIQIQRYDIATGNYRTVSMLKTDANGQDISYLEQTTAFYKVCIFEVGNPNPVYCSNAFHLTSDSYSIALTTSSALSWSSLVGVAHNLTFDSGSDQFELTYSDPNEKTTQFCLDVFEERFTQRVLVSSNCLSANSGTVQTSVDAINGTTYSAFAFATLFTNTSGQYISDNFLLSQITHSYGMSEAFQNNGLFFIWLLVAIFSLLSFYSPSLSLLLAPLPIIFGSFSGIIAIPMGTAMALYLGFIILAVIVGGKE